jgi:hypothetical protein
MKAATARDKTVEAVVIPHGTSEQITCIEHHFREIMRALGGLI